MDVERDETCFADADPLLLEEVALDRGADRIMNRDPATQAAGLADHALPRQSVARFARLERGTGHARTTGDARELRDLTVRRDAAFGNLANDGVDAAVERFDVPVHGLMLQKLIRDEHAVLDLHRDEVTGRRLANR